MAKKGMKRPDEDEFQQKPKRKKPKKDDPRQVPEVK
ncbi:hypothetical protein CLHOM_21620 [Clostridium homopropionicum DSM 5847]|uniref:Uncharacterized protein n=1 Tax=Clostridium homopropionicum DSM 5847 TaxID=1121318 RepID=A0A0L6Z8R7_9CLOT|nr:hypothetical protein CLHOM_21620 [Clostridium homopropionicum DSM 5847]